MHSVSHSFPVQWIVERKYQKYECIGKSLVVLTSVLAVITLIGAVLGFLALKGHYLVGINSIVMMIGNGGTMITFFFSLAVLFTNSVLTITIARKFYNKHIDDEKLREWDERLRKWQAKANGLNDNTCTHKVFKNKDGMLFWLAKKKEGEGANLTIFSNQVTLKNNINRSGYLDLIDAEKYTKFMIEDYLLKYFLTEGICWVQRNDRINEVEVNILFYVDTKTNKIMVEYPKNVDDYLEKHKLKDSHQQIIEQGRYPIPLGEYLKNEYKIPSDTDIDLQKKILRPNEYICFMLPTYYKHYPMIFIFLIKKNDNSTHFVYYKTKEAFIKQHKNLTDKELS